MGRYFPLKRCEFKKRVSRGTVGTRESGSITSCFKHIHCIYLRGGIVQDIKKFDSKNG